MLDGRQARGRFFSEQLRRGLIVSPSLAGHRQVYCSVLTHLLLQEGLQVTVVTRPGIEQAALRGSYMDYYEAESRVSVVDDGSLGWGGLGNSRRRFSALIKANRPDLVVLLEADGQLSMLTSLALPIRTRRSYKMVGIFIRSTNYIYGDSRLRQLVGRGKSLPQPRRSDPVFFHEYLLSHRSPLDAALCLDEHFVEGHKETHAWLPDIYKPFSEVAAVYRDPERDLWTERMGEFSEKNKGRPFLVYFGAAQRRRGYHTLLQLARDEDAAFVHCGLRSDAQECGIDVAKVRDELRAQRRILETNSYIRDPVLIERFFRCSDRMVLPYDSFWGSSGVMLQALEYKLPVLVASRGLMGWRVRTGSLGATYAAGEYEDLRARFRSFSALPAVSFADDISRFMDPFRRAELERVLKTALF